MKKATVSIQIEQEKLRAIQFYAGKKDSTLQAELEELTEKLYEKYVPAQTREYIESLVSEEAKPRPRPDRGLRERAETRPVPAASPSAEP